MDFFNSKIYNPELTNGLLVHHLFEQQAELTPDLIAVKHGVHELTYARLNQKAGALAAAIIKLSPASSSIGVSTHRSIETIISVIAILKAGKAYLPLDPDYPRERIEQIVGDSQIDTCILTEPQKHLFEGLALNLLFADHDYANAQPLTGINNPDGAYVLYTSGSTGIPKGVVMGHAALVNLLIWQRVNSAAAAGTHTLQFAPLSFDVSFQEIFATLGTGGTLVLIDDELRADPVKMLGLITKTDINRIFLPFVVLQYLAEAAIANKSIPACLQEVMTAGEQLKITPQISAFFKALPNCVLFNQYGPTETHVITQLKLDGDVTAWEVLPTIGVPISHTEILILDEDLTPVPYGETGELCVAGVCLANGYLNKPGLTAEKFVDLQANGKTTRIYRTGDLALYRADGQIEYLGRRDTQVKIRGNRVELGEIEVLLNNLENIQQAVVTAREDNEGQKRLVAYLVSSSGVQDTSSARARISEKLPDYMMPSAFVWLTDLPKTTSGKVDRKALPAPDRHRPELSVLYRSPVSIAEKRTALLWAELLLLDKVGVDDIFFELGGNSLLALKTVTRLKEQYNYTLPVTKLYQYPTVKGIAACIEGNQVTARLTAGKLPKRQSNNDIAVIGMAARFPGADTIDELWNVLTEGCETISFFKDDEIDRNIPAAVRNAPEYVKARGIIRNAGDFDAAFFGITPKVAELMDPQHRVFLELAYEALESSGHLPTKYSGLIGVFAGTGNNTYYTQNVLSNTEKIAAVGSFLVSTINEKDYIATRTAYQLNLNGPAVSVHAACSTSLLAIVQAADSIRNGQCNVALAGGISVTSPVKSGHLYQQGTMLSPDGHCRSFDADSDGTVFSDGAGVVVLKSMEEAERDGDTIYAVLKGVGLNNDGGGKGSFTAPSAAGQAGAIAMAIADAGVDPATISYIEAHGTATSLGDPIEIEGLSMAFGPQQKNQYCAIGSIKSNMGHTVAASGVAGFIKTTLALYHRQIPASLFYKKANPNIDFENSPFYVNASLAEWKAEGIRRAGVSSFGVGGTNVHTILEEYIQPEKKAGDARSLSLITWSAKTKESAANYAGKLANFIAGHQHAEPADIAYSLHTTRADYRERNFVIAASRQDLAEQLKNFKPTAANAKTLNEKADDVVFMFPGQGAQYAGMGQELYHTEPVFAASVNECIALLKGTAHEDILSVIYPAEDTDAAAEKLKNTFYTQPAIFITSLAMARLWMSYGIYPSIFVGHSIGEFVAAHLAGVFSLQDALHLITIRARLVSEMPGGGMLSVRMNDAELAKILPQNLCIAAVNSNQLCVVAGKSEDVNAFAHYLTEQGIPGRLLQTSHAFHSAMMDPVIAPFEQAMRKIKLSKPVKPIASTVSGTWLTEAEATDPSYWAQHLRKTVRFAKAIDTLLEDSGRLFLEVGPGTALATLTRQQAAGKPFAVLSGIERADDQSESFSVLKAVGQLWLNGIGPDWAAYDEGRNAKKLRLPSYSFEHKTYWVNPVSAVALPQAVNQPQHEIPATPPQPLSLHTIMRKDLLTQKLQEIFEDASGIEISDASKDLSFIEIGFDSLLLTQIATNLKKTFNVTITFRKLFEEYNSIDLLADYLDHSLPAGTFEPQATPAAINGFHIPGNPTADPALALITQQLQMLASQVAGMQGAASPGMAVGQPVAPPPVKIAASSDITAEEMVELKKPFGATARIEKQVQGLNTKQQAFLNKLIADYNQKTIKSKNETQAHRAYMADPRVVSGFRPLTKEIVYPLVVNRSKGSRLWDIDGNEYIDALNGFGSNMLGYQPEPVKKALQEQLEKGYEIGPQHELAGEVSSLLCEFTGFDRAALCSTGSEAVLGAMRIARTVTGRSLIVAFSGSYHGIIDEVIVRGTKKLRSVPAAPGIMPESVQNMLILDYGTDESLRIIKERAHEIAAVLVEVVQSRRPEFLPVEFLHQLRSITAASKTALVFDEVITGFRMHPGGMQGVLGIRADIGTYGKVIGGGLPIGAIIGTKEYMDALDGGFWQYGDQSTPESGVTYFAGTFVRHPLALAAARASLLYMKEKGPALQQSLTDKANKLAAALNEICRKHHIPVYAAQYGSLWKFKYKEEYPYSELLFTMMRLKGIHIWDGFPCFMTDAHGDHEINIMVEKFGETISELLAAEFIPVDNTAAAAQVSDVPDYIKPINSQEPVINNRLQVPPVPGARLGRDKDGNPAWFISDDTNPGKYLQVKLNN